MKKQDIVNFLHSRIHAVIATTGKNNQPESALIGFAQSDAGEIYFGTNKNSKKYTNLLENNTVALVIGWEADFQTMQYEGVATELTGQEKEQAADIIEQKIPGAKKYRSQVGQTYFKVTPTWVRFTDLQPDPPIVEELTL